MPLGETGDGCSCGRGYRERSDMYGRLRSARDADVVIETEGVGSELAGETRDGVGRAVLPGMRMQAGLANKQAHSGSCSSALGNVGARIAMRCGAEVAQRQSSSEACRHVQKGGPARGRGPFALFWRGRLAGAPAQLDRTAAARRRGQGGLEQWRGQPMEARGARERQVDK